MAILADLNRATTQFAIFSHQLGGSHEIFPACLDFTRRLCGSALTMLQLRNCP
jgi:hypothetical protein